MSDSDRDGRPARKPEGSRPARAGGANSGPAKGGPRSDKPGRSDKPPRATQHAPRGGQGRRDEPRLWTREGTPARGDRDARRDDSYEDRDPYGTRSVRTRHDDPEIPEDVKPADLDRVARAQLKTLSKENADGVAVHLVMAARLIDSDPQLAHRHATSAARRAGRIAVVRETLAITAYATEDYALALRELRTYRRISGRDDQLPMMVDSERGLGRPDRALELGRSVDRSTLPVDVQVELAIAMSGARLDLEQLDAALVELEIPQLDPTRAFSWSPALFSAYAAVLEDLGRADEAETWYQRADRAADALEGGSGESDEDVVEVFEEDVEELGYVTDGADAGESDDSESDTER
ncbi:hypothetical protein [Homoserinimonas hongtaonis]|uniref:hypothetical protein n=1 Tax=Homoserinimonas hongtaonis TaxID=2079791 RepID=UPI001E3F0839|nr:hypothetical protein [Salinibacterium hongtaonis]